MPSLSHCVRATETASKKLKNKNARLEGGGIEGSPMIDSLLYGGFTNRWADFAEFPMANTPEMRQIGFPIVNFSAARFTIEPYLRAIYRCVILLKPNYGYVWGFARIMHYVSVIFFKGGVEMTYPKY